MALAVPHRSVRASSETKSVRGNVFHGLDDEPLTVTLVPVGKVADRLVDASLPTSEIAERL
jgi:hypothetical protein